MSYKIEVSRKGGKGPKITATGYKSKAAACQDAKVLAKVTGAGGAVKVKASGSKPAAKRNPALRVGDRVRYADAGLRKGPAGPGMEASRYAAALRGTVTSLDGSSCDVRWDGYGRAGRVACSDVVAVKGNPRRGPKGSAVAEAKTLVPLVRFPKTLPYAGDAWQSASGQVHLDARHRRNPGKLLGWNKTQGKLTRGYFLRPPAGLDPWWEIEKVNMGYGAFYFTVTRGGEHVGQRGTLFLAKQLAEGDAATLLHNRSF